MIGKTDGAVPEARRWDTISVWAVQQSGAASIKRRKIKPLPLLRGGVGVGDSESKSGECQVRIGTPFSLAAITNRLSTRLLTGATI